MGRLAPNTVYVLGVVIGGAVGGAVCAAWSLWRSKPGNGGGTVADDISQVIGNTPVVRLNYLSKLTKCEIWAKLELLNPGGSAKDRIARAIVDRAEQTGKLRPGHSGTVYEGTSGSTGISLAMVCRARGYEAHIVVPDDTSSDKVGLLESLGAHVHKVRPAGIADEGHYVNVARRLAKETGGIFANQFETEVNWQAHYATTGPEIAAQLGSHIDAFVTGAGTGGTIAGVSRFLKQCIPHLRTVLADVPGSGLYNKVVYGVMYNNTEREGHRRRHQVDTVVEGIGLNRVTANFAAAEDYIDDSRRVSDDDARYMASVLVEKEGLFVGSSSAVNGVATLREALSLGPGHTVVTILCDSGTRHLSKFWAMPKNDNCEIAREIQALEEQK